MTITIRWRVERPNEVERLAQFNLLRGHLWLHAGQYYPAKKGTYWIVALRNGQTTGVPTEQEARDLLWFLCSTGEST
jgi:hypothetical protein